MGFEQTVLRDQKLVRLVLRGKLDLDMCLGAMRDLEAALAGETGFGILLDARETDYNASLSEVRTLAQEAGRPGSLVGHRIAIVVSTVVQFGLGRMFSAFLDLAGGEAAVFRDVDSAMEWLTATSGPPVAR